jgi:arylsulfatase
VLLALGSLQGGFSFFVQHDRLAYVHNFVGREWTRVDADVSVPAGAHQLAFRFTRTDTNCGVAALSIDGDVAGEGEISRFTPMRWNLVGAGLWCGTDPGLPVCDDYDAPFRFTGTLHRVVVEVNGAQQTDPKGLADIAVARQ